MPCSTGWSSPASLDVPDVVVVVATVPDCDCEYAINPVVQAGPPVCLTIAYGPVNETQKGKCKIDGSEVCTTEVKCIGNMRVDFSVNNWGACCPQPAGQPPVAMQVCLNGVNVFLIAGGAGYSVGVTVGGNKLGCAHGSNSYDNDDGADVISVQCGNGPNVCTGQVFQYTALFEEACRGCAG